jgi:hypothetical protein
VHPQQRDFERGDADDWQLLDGNAHDEGGDHVNEVSQRAKRIDELIIGNISRCWK